MKYLIAILLLFPLKSFTQDSCKLKKTQDPYTKELKFSTGFIPIGTARVSIQATKLEIDFLFSLGDGICLDDKTTATVFYPGTKVKTNLKNSGTMNCDGLFHLNFKNQANPNSYLQNLFNKQVSSIKFIDNTKKETVIELTGEQQQTFKAFVQFLPVVDKIPK